MAVTNDQPLSVGNLAALIDSGALGGGFSTPLLRQGLVASTSTPKTRAA